MVSILFFFSGVTALIYQMVWMRELVLVFGASMFAISTLLTAFMGGLALGSDFFGRRADRYSNPLRVYGLLELGIGGYAFLVPFLLSSLIPIYQFLHGLFHFSFYVFSLVRFVMAVLVLLLPTALMGGTLPVLARLYKNHAEIGKGVGLLYAFNTLGAVIGVLGAGFILLPALGLNKTVLLAATLNGAVGLLAIGRGRSRLIPVETAAERAPVSLPKGDRLRRRILLATFALSGFAAMIYEVVWTRILTLILGSTLYSFATMLATFLLGLAIGSFLFSVFLKRFSRPLLLLALVQGGIALFAFGGEFLFPLLPVFFFKLLEVFHSEGGIISASKFFIVGAVMLIPTVLMGGVFPLVIHLLTSGGSSSGAKRKTETAADTGLGSIVGRAYSINTLGTIVGSFAIGFILLPSLGIQKSLHVAILTNAALSLLLWMQMRDMGEARLWAVGGVGAFLVVVGFSTPAWNPLQMSSELFGKLSTLDLLFYKEGISSTVTVVQHPTLAKQPHLTLAIDGKPNASTTGDMKTQILVGHLPMLLAPQAKEVLSIGHGSGVTTGAIAAHPLAKLVTLEIEPAVVEASRLFDPFNGEVLNDPRVQLVVDDARNYLILSKDRFDVIVSEPSHPWRSGSSKLFTEEFFRLGRSRLRPGGIFAQWIHFYGIRAPELKAVIRTFHSIFPHVFIFYTDAGDLILLGSDREIAIGREEIARRMAVPAVKKDLSRADVYSPFDLWAYFLLGPKEIDRYVGPGIFNTDDYTVVEFQTPKSLFEDTISIHMADMKGAARGGDLYLVQPDEPNRTKGEAYFAIARGLIRNDKENDARELIQKGLLLHPAAEGDWLLGRVLQKQGDRPGAARAWQAALQKDPSHPESLLSLAQQYQEQGAYDLAEPLLSRLRKEHPEKVQAAFYHGVSLYYGGRYQKALEELNQGVIFSEPFVYYYQSLVFDKLKKEAEAKEALGRFIGSLNDWRKELEMDPKRFSALPYAKQIEWRKKNGIQIPEEERMALLFNRMVAEPLNHLYSGTGLFILGMFKPATIELEEIVKELGNQAAGSIVQYYLGLAYKEMGQIAPARQALETFIDHSPLDPKDLRITEAKRTLEQFKRATKGGS
ncbi:MAG: tetratricopeptide repeat protein [Candidatus Manganitrophaceae bacterium]|nr:MAG: tetratricopeptide repeat protein [Candidatus Manganitrophaceae bacterium]